MATFRDTYILEIQTAAAKRNLTGLNAGVAGVGAGLGRLRGLVGPAAAAFAAFGAIQGIKTAIDDMDELAKAARSAGAAASDDAFRGFQVMTKALGEAGVDAGTAERAMLNLSTRLQQGAEGSQAFAGIVETLGDSIKDSEGNIIGGADALEVLLNAQRDGIISTEEFNKVVGGRAGPQILAMFGSMAGSAEDLAATLADVEANSNIVGLDAATNAEVFNDTMGRLREVAGRLGTDLVTALLPALVELAEGALAVLPSIISGVQTAFKTLKPVFDLNVMVIRHAIIPALQLLFSILGRIAEFIGPFVEGGIRLMSSAFEALGTIVERVVGFFRSAFEFLGSIKDRAVELASGVRESFSSMTSGMTDMAGRATERVTGFFRSMYDRVVGNSIVPDMASGVLNVFDQMSGGMVSRIGDAITGVTSALSTLASTVGERFTGIASQSLTNLRSLMSSMGQAISSGVSNLASGISSRLTGMMNNVRNMANRAGSVFSNFGFSNPFQNFAGFFANGGMIPAGQFGIAGESGPEVITGPATVTPLSQLGGGMTQVTYNINAVDAASFRSLLARDPSFVHAVVQRGAAGVAGRR
jgi:hypothetical protein